MAGGDAASLYDALGVAASASAEEIKRAYRRNCLLLHPDKNPGDQEAVAKFQALQKLYAVLSDPERRKIYDQTGETDEELTGAKFEDLCRHFRAAFKKVTEEDIAQFYDDYRGSADEARDLLKHYEQQHGNMPVVFEYVMCSEPELDSHRFMDAIQAAIDAGSVSKHKRFASWAKGVQKLPRPADPLKKQERRKGAGSEVVPAGASTALTEMRQKRAKEADAFYDQLALKYAPKPKSSKKAKAHVEPSDEEFLACQQRVLNKGTEPSTSKASKEAAAPARAKGAAAAGKGKKAAAPAGEGRGRASPAKRGKS